MNQVQDPITKEIDTSPLISLPIAVKGVAVTNGNGHVRNWLVILLGTALILEILSQTGLAVLLMFEHLQKSSYEPIVEFMKNGVQIKTMLISGLLGALTQRALDTLANK